MQSTINAGQAAVRRMQAVRGFERLVGENLVLNAAFWGLHSALFDGSEFRATVNGNVSEAQLIEWTATVNAAAGHTPAQPPTQPPPLPPPTSNSHVIDVSVIGAKGDGRDDSDAFIEAFKQAAKSDKPVIVPPGTYTIGQQVDINYPDSVVTGIGNACIKRKDNSGPITCLRALAPRPKISGLTFDGNRQNNIGNDSGELLVYGDDARLSNVTFKEGEYISLQALGARGFIRWSRFSSEIAFNCKFGIYAGGRATDWQVDTSTFIRYRLNAIITAPYAPNAGASRIRISRCLFIENNDDGAGQVDLQQWGSVQDSTFLHAPNGSSFGIEAQGGGIFTGNILDGNGSNRSAIEIQGGVGYEVAGNFASGYSNGLLLEEVFSPTDDINEHDNHWNCPVKICGHSRGLNNRLSSVPVR